MLILSARVLYAALLSLDSINAGLTRVALLFLLFHHMHRTLVSFATHSIYCN
jgi:hypothetical protein